ncbi:hypothetical protein ABT297_23655 [Dactylosporangium sp. NPDC000555]
MFRTLRRAGPQTGVRFCDSCATVSTPDKRTRARIERHRIHRTAITGPR